MKVFALIAAVCVVGSLAGPVSDCGSGLLKGKMAGFAGNHQSYMQLSTDFVMPDLDKFSACWWVQTFRTTGSTADITYFTYTTDDEYKGSIFAKDIRSFKIYVNRLRAYGGSDFDIRYGLWHHMCFTWSNVAGDYVMYKDGRPLKNGSGFKKSEVILGGGVLFVGQYLAKTGGKFWDERYSYEGNMASLNFWNDVLPAADIEAIALSRGSTKECGSLIPWTMFAESDLIGVETCPTALTGKPRVMNCDDGEFGGKVLQMGEGVGSYGYVQSFQAVPDLKAFTMCAWGKTKDTLETIDMFSYRVKDQKQGSFCVMNPTNLQLYVNAEPGTPSGGAINNDMWYHVCATWDSATGAHQYFANGNLMTTGEGLVQGQTVMGGGVMILGVPQKKMGADFDWKNRFSVELTDFNVWSDVKSADDISNMLCSPCHGGCGNVISWHYFTSNDISPDVLVKDADEVPYEKKM